MRIDVEIKSVWLNSTICAKFSENERLPSPCASGIILHSSRTTSNNPERAWLLDFSGALR